MTAAQSGQYNYSRSLRRKASYPVYQSLVKFCEDVFSLVFLLNRRYMPFYKWASKAAGSLPVLGAFISQAVEKLLQEEKPQKKEGYIETICARIIEALKGQGLSDSQSDFLLDHGPRVHSLIRDDSLKRLDMWWSGA